MHRRLALYSDQILTVTDPIDAKLVEWMPPGGTIGYLPSSPDPGRIWFESRVDYYARLGFKLQFFGVEDEFVESRILDLFCCDAIHLTGGNTFQFLYWLRYRGLMEKLKKYAEQGGVLVGVSAGAILMTPNIETSLICGDTLYAGLSDYAGLSLVDFAFVPHIDGTTDMDVKIENYSLGFAGPVYSVPDGSGIIVEETSIIKIGPIFSHLHGKPIEKEGPTN